MTTFVDPVDAEFRQGMAHAKSRNFKSAEESFRKVTQLDPRYSPAHHNHGTALAALDRHAEAVESFARAVEIEPNYAQAHFGLGVSLRVLGRTEEAIASLLRALALDPRHDEAYYYLGLEHQEAGRLNEAVACFLQASDLNPNDADIYTALATTLLRLKLPDAAVQAFEKALSLNPDDSVARANLMYRLARDCDWDRLELLKDWVPDLGVSGGHVPPFTLLAFEDCPERHRLRSERFAAASYSLVKPLPVPARPRGRPERLRLGYFSADFHDHATMFLAARLFELHDRERYIVHGYSYGRTQAGPMRERAVRAFDQFKDVADLSNQAIAELARSDAIDIAVDLKGYTESHRLGIFARRPSPVQITFLGYPGTLGAPFIDYLIADGTVIPSDQRPGYAEKIVYLPHSYQVNDDTRPLPEQPATRAEVGLPAEGLVLCCFNNSYKITPAEFGIWMELLKRVDGSILWLLATPGHMETNLRAEAARREVEPDRLIFAPRTSLHNHLARLRFADLFLDTFNCNAHTTASDALWAGVPVLTRAGQGFAARVAASLLHAIGLDELDTENERDYEALALALASNPDRLAAIRAQLETNRTTMPLFDTRMFARNLEAGYELAYERYLKGEEPADITVPA